MMSADGCDAGRAQFGEPYFLIEGEPSFSPDGQRAVLAREDAKRLNLWIAGLDGSGFVCCVLGATHGGLRRARDRLHHDERATGLLDALAEHPITVRRFSRDVGSVDWSPDGRRLLMVMEPRRANAHNSLAAVDAADPTSQPTNISPPRRVRAWDLKQAVWSPDGHRIAFVAYRLYEPPDNEPYVRPSLWVMRAGGGHVRRLVRLGGKTAGEIPDSLSWQPVVS